MLRISARRDYSLLVPHGRVLIRNRALTSFLEKQPNVQNKTLILKRNNNRNCDVTNKRRMLSSAPVFKTELHDLRTLYFLRHRQLLKAYDQARYPK